MAKLNTSANIADPDGFYAGLIQTYEAMDEAKIEGFNARLILLLANHIGDVDVINDAIAAAAEADQ